MASQELCLVRSGLVCRAETSWRLDTQLSLLSLTQRHQRRRCSFCHIFFRRYFSFNLPPGQVLVFARQTSRVATPTQERRAPAALYKLRSQPPTLWERKYVPTVRC